jgi:hypothetical protein
MQRKVAILALAAVAVGLVVDLSFNSNPLRQSDARLRAWLLSKTPLGSNLAEVRSVLDQHGWHDVRFQQMLPHPAAEPFLGGEIGKYQGLPWHTSVRAFWEFDSSNRLVGIQIQRIADSP